WARASASTCRPSVSASGRHSAGARRQRSHRSRSPSPVRRWRGRRRRRPTRRRHPRPPATAATASSPASLPKRRADSQAATALMTASTGVGSRLVVDADRARGGPGRRGWYEVYYVTAALPGGRGAWLRWTLHAPRSGDASTALWAVAFDTSRPRWFAARNQLPGSAWRPLDQGGVALGGAEVRPDGCRGEAVDTL